MRIILISILCFITTWTTISAQNIPSAEDLMLADAYRLEIDKDIAFQLGWLRDKEDYFNQLTLERFGGVFGEEQQVAQYFVQQIFIPLPQRGSRLEYQSIEQQVDSIFEALTLDWSQAHFTQLLQKFSADKKARWLNSLEETKEFQRVLKQLKTGEISRPFTSPRGLHIIQLLDQREAQTFSSTKIIRDRTQALCRLQISINQAAQHELLRQGQTTLPLLKSPKTSYTQADFDSFAQGNSELGIDALWLKFQDFVIFEEMKAELLDDQQLQVALDSIYKKDLIAASFQQAVLDAHPISEQVLEDFYEAHSADYLWKTPRFEGMVVFCKNSKIRKALHQELSRAPLNEWQEIVGRFNTSETLIHSLMGSFEQGEEGVIDAYVFKKGKKKNFRIKGYTKVRVYGEVLKGPASYATIRAQVEADYIRFLEQGWLSRLEQDYKSGKLVVNF